MKTTNKRKSMLVTVMAIVAAITALVIVVSLGTSNRTVKAETYSSADNYSFTLVTDSDGTPK